VEAFSFREYLLQRPQRGGQRLCRDYSQFLRQPGLVHGANLIEQDQTLPASMIDSDPKRRLATRRGHGGDQRCAQMIVHFERGHHDTRTCLPDSAPDGGIKIHQPNLSARHQTNSDAPEKHFCFKPSFLFQVLRARNINIGVFPHRTALTP